MSMKKANKTIKVSLEFEVVDAGGAIECGLRQNWLGGKDGKTTINLSCDAGVGSPFIQQD